VQFARRRFSDLTFLIYACASRPEPCHPHVRWQGSREIKKLQLHQMQSVTAKIALRHVAVSTYLENGQASDEHQLRDEGWNVHDSPTSTPHSDGNYSTKNIISEITTLFDNLSLFTIVTIPIVISTCSADDDE
jgi:hypothetical protein